MNKIILIVFFLFSATSFATDMLNLTYSLTDKNLNKIQFSPNNEGAGWNTRVKITEIKTKITEYSGSTIRDISRKLQGENTPKSTSEITILCSVSNESEDSDACTVIITFYDIDGFNIGETSSPKTEIPPNCTRRIQWSHRFSDDDIKRMKEATILLVNKSDLDDLYRKYDKGKDDHHD